MISSVTTSAYNAFSTIAAKIQATSLWSQLPAQSTVGTVASNVLFSKYTHAVIGVGIFCAAAKRAYSNYQNYVSTAAYKEYINNPQLLASVVVTKDENGNDKRSFIIPEERTRILEERDSAIMLPVMIATVALTLTIVRLILLP